MTKEQAMLNKKFVYLSKKSLNLVLDYADSHNDVLSQAYMAACAGVLVCERPSYRDKEEWRLYYEFHNMSIINRDVIGRMILKKIKKINANSR